MDPKTVGAWTVGALAGLAAAFYIRRTTRTEADPEEKLRGLIGPGGIAERDRNRAEREEKNRAERRDL